MDDKEIAIASLVLLGVMIESHTDNGLSTPIFYDALASAVELSEELGIKELTERLQCLQMEVGEMNIALREKAEQLQKQFGTLEELLDNLTTSDE